ncbi:MAG: long-chain-fatty-acid--CoA ligase [Deltaproteobacteria bacterium]|nr:long-chain-fatty-acid--CoA ligase [Deltaproteobacteria bacterium]
MNIPFILEKAVNLYGDKEAIVSGKKRFTYGAFGDRVFRLANYLAKCGIGKGDTVSILHRNSHEYMEAYFAVGQLGAILNPLNYRLSPKELAFILKDSRARLLISEKSFQEQVVSLNELGIKMEKVVWTGDGDLPGLSQASDYEISLKKAPAYPVRAAESNDEDIAHLYYTSGTTGVPKGVILSHKNVCSHSLAAIAELALKDEDRWIHVAPMFHLADAWATFAITWVGGMHILIPDFDPIVVLSAIRDERITITNMVPTMLNMLINSPGVESYDFSSLRAILSGGAPIAPEVVRKIMEVFKCAYIQTYGMTETSPYLTLSILKDHLRHLSPDEQFVYMAKTGRPFLAVRLKVVREDGSEVEPDDKEVGEIIVRGDIVTKGYWNRPEETAKAIRDGWLYTGDMAVMDREGYVNIVDRKKDMIITGGENVYSVEVENVLYSHPAILEVAVIGVPDPKWGEVIKAVVVLIPGQTATGEEIIAYCKKHIAGYKTPKIVSFIESLPKTGSGKICKEDLRKNKVSI